MASLVWRSDRSRWYSFFHVGKKHTGKPLQEAPRRKKLSKRERAMAVAEAERIADDFTPVEIVTLDLETAMANWLDDVKATRALATWERYRSVANQFLDVVVSKDEVIPINMVAEAHIRKYRDLRLKVRSPRTVKTDMKAIGSFFNWVRKIRDPVTGKRLLRYNPAEDVEFPAQEEVKGRVFPSDADILRLLAEVAGGGSVFRGLAVMGALGGMRRGEVLGLEWRQVDFAAGLIYVYGKSKHPRPVPMHVNVRSLLSELHYEGAEGLVFPSPYAAKVNARRTFEARQFNTWLKDNGFGFTHHALRRWFNNALRLRTELSASSRRLIVGHEDEETNRLYQNPQAEEARPFVESLLAG